MVSRFLLRDAMPVFAVVMFLSNRHKPVLCWNDWTNRAGFWHEDFLPPVPHCFKEIWVSPKIRILPSETLSQTPDLENFAKASRSRYQQNSLSMVEFVDDTYTTVDESCLFTAS